MSNGNIVDRREIPSAIPIPANSLMETPEPKVLWRCPVCGHVMTEEQSKGYRGCPTGLHFAQHVAILPNAALTH